MAEALSESDRSGDNSGCSLCGLPVPEPAITDDEVEGEYCCTGCLEVSRLLEGMDEDEASTIRSRVKEGDAGGLKEAIPENAETAFLQMEGMHCATCETFIETIGRRREGIYNVEASYASDLAKVWYDPDKLGKQELPRALSKAGYKAAWPDDDAGNEEEETNTVARLVIGGFFAMMAMAFYILFLYPVYLGSEGLMDLSGDAGLFTLANIAVMSTLVLGYTGYPILRGAWVSLRVLKPNMDLLVALAALSAYGYSIVALWLGEQEVYFDVSLTIIMVVSIGNYYEGLLKSRASGLVKELARGQVSRARRIDEGGGTHETVDLEQLEEGDLVLVKAGERIPIDGTVAGGEAAVDESLITGESLPVTRRQGDKVVGGAIVTDHALKVKAGPKAENTLDRLVHIVWNIQSSRPGAQRTADRLAKIFVPAVLLLAAMAFAVQMAAGASVSLALLVSLSVLIVSCPCALGLATPLAISSGLREAMKRQIVVKNSSLFERVPQIETVAFDKTGTLTTGQMQLINGDGGMEPGTLQLAGAVEQYSPHPVARAIREAQVNQHGANGAGGRIADVIDYRSHSRGASAQVDGENIVVGHPDWLDENGYRFSDRHRSKLERVRQRANVPVAIGKNSEVLEVLEVGDQQRPETLKTLESIKKLGLWVVVLTGDSQAAARRLESLEPIDQVFAEVRPESKAEMMKGLSRSGATAMIGDGNNDGPALAEADLGIATGTGGLAANSADAVILNSKLSSVPAIFKLAKHTNRRIKQNLSWAFLYNAVAIPLAFTGYINPLFAALAMAASSILVVINSTRKMRIPQL